MKLNPSLEQWVWFFFTLLIDSSDIKPSAIDLPYDSGRSLKHLKFLRFTNHPSSSHKKLWNLSWKSLPRQVKSTRPTEWNTSLTMANCARIFHVLVREGLWRPRNIPLKLRCLQSQSSTFRFDLDLIHSFFPDIILCMHVCVCVCHILRASWTQESHSIEPWSSTANSLSDCAPWPPTWRPGLTSEQQNWSCDEKTKSRKTKVWSSQKRLPWLGIKGCV